MQQFWYNWGLKICEFSHGKEIQQKINKLYLKILKKLMYVPKMPPHWENSFFESKKHFSDIRSKKKFLWIKESFVNSKKNSLIRWNLFIYIKEKFFEPTKLSLIQRNVFFDRISNKYFFDSKKLFSGYTQGVSCYSHEAFGKLN